MYSIELPDETFLDLDGNANIARVAAYGAGMPPVENISTAYGLADGALYQRTAIKPRVLQLQLDALGEDFGALADIRAQLVGAVNPHRGALPMRIWYDRAGPIPLYLDAYYEAGLEGGKTEGLVEPGIMLRFLATDPYWHGEEGSAKELTVRDSMANSSYILHRAADGTWSKPGGVSVNNYVYVIEVAASGVVYVGGLFTAAGGSSANYIASWNGSTWSALGSGLNGVARCIAFGPDGQVYVGGNFTTAGGSGANYIASWNGSAWSALGSGLNGAPLEMAMGADGKLYVAGQFTTAGGSTANRIAVWDGSTWATLGTGLDGEARTIVVAANGDIYVGGTFTQAGGATANKVARWNGTAWSNVGAGLGTVSSIDALALGASGVLYAGGNYTVAGGAIANRIAQWNGVAWAAMGAGFDGTVTQLQMTATGVLYASGSFQATAEGRPLPSRVAYWANGIWLPEAGGRDSAWTTVGGLWTDGKELYIGGTFNGTWYYGGPDTIHNPGSARAYPVLTLHGPGRLYHIINYTTGQAIHFDLTLLNGETLTVDLRPGVKTITSSWRGNMIAAIVSGNLVDWYLAPGDNRVSVWIDDGGAAGEMIFEPRYWSVDGVPT